MVHSGTSASEENDGASGTVDPATDDPKEEVIPACKAHYVGQAECAGCDSPGCPNTASYVLKKIAGECMVTAAMGINSVAVMIFFGVGLIVTWGHCAICILAWCVAGGSLGGGVGLLGWIKRHAQQVWRGPEDVVRAVGLYIATVCAVPVFAVSFTYGMTCFSGCAALDCASTGM